MGTHGWNDPRRDSGPMPEHFARRLLLPAFVLDDESPRQFDLCPRDLRLVSLPFFTHKDGAPAAHPANRRNAKSPTVWQKDSPRYGARKSVYPPLFQSLSNCFRLSQALAHGLLFQ